MCVLHTAGGGWRAPALAGTLAEELGGQRRRLISSEAAGDSPSSSSSSAQSRTREDSLAAGSGGDDSSVDLSRDARALLSAMVTSTYKLQHESIALEMKTKEELGAKKPQQKQTTTTSGSVGKKQTTKKKKAAKQGKIADGECLTRVTLHAL